MKKHPSPTRIIAHARLALNTAAVFASALLAEPALAETITFEGPGYVAGRRPPVPWTDSYEARGDLSTSAVFNVTNNVGVGGSSCLSVSWTGLYEGYAVYLLPRPLTVADGPQRISVKFNPPGNTHYNFANYGSVAVGNGWAQIATGTRRGVVFMVEDWHYTYPHHTNEFLIVLPNTNATGNLVAGYFVPDVAPNYYQVSFELDAAWTNMTLIVISPAGVGITNSTVWNGSAIDKVWLGECQSSTYDTGNPTYDDLVIGSGTLPAVTPGISSQPQPQTRIPGTNVAFTVWASGSAPFGYQWWKGETALVDGGNRLGATWPTLTLTNLAVGDSGDYTVVITNTAGAITSLVAHLTIQIPPPVITAQPQSQSVGVGGNVSFTVAASGVGTLGYQWRRYGTNLSDDGRITGAITNNLSIAAVTTGDAGNFTVVVTGDSGSVTSQVATLLVHTLVQFPPGLMALWPGEGDAKDAVGVCHGTLNGTTFAPGHAGQAFRFSGSTYVKFPELPATDVSRMSSWTMAAWVKPSSVANAVPIIYSEGPWGASLGLMPGTAQIESWLNDANRARGTTAIPLNQWAHVALVYDGANRRFYLNGNADGVAAAVALSPDNAGAALGAVTSGSGNSMFVGLVDDMAVFNRALTPAEIQLVASLSVTPAPAHFDSISRLGNLVQLSFTVSPGRTNVLQGSSNLLDWVDVKVYGPTNGTLTFSESNSLPKTFYRLAVP